MTRPTTRLTDRWVLITGAGHGLGRALAGAFADAGSRIIVTDSDRSGIDMTTEWLSRRGNAVIGLEMDVTCPESIERARREVMTRAGAVDVLVNNAGIVRGGLFTDVPVDEHLATFEVNTHGPIRVTHAFLPVVLGSPVAHLVNIVSASALIGLPGASTYAASKWAVLGFTESLREELRHSGHRHASVTAVCPSYISTGLFSGVRPPRFTRLLTPAEVARQVVRAVLAGRPNLMLPRAVSLIPLSRALLPIRWSQKLGDWTGIHTGMADWLGHNRAEQPTGRNHDGSTDETFGRLERVDSTEPAVTTGS
ncbi:MAG TPA: short-chain dehydrogenase [Planctomycetaceae bacterium]|nr:short-chain dehydrogenase [Planctomycetaceae bacterium]HCC99882.1 short-chain dehydrogenase [Planctomycetaceae bacterium]|tara:strand:+ start:1348 stop:2274 length:927 start_codon:yes stop_codon:yes gene_type:complete